MANKQGIKAGDAYIMLGLEATGISKDLALFAAEFEDMGSKMVRAGSFGAALFGATAGMIGWAATEAGLYDAALRRVDMTYGSLASAQKQWMDDFSNQTLRGKKQIAEMVATFGGFTKGLGFAGDDAAFLAQGLARISSNMATFASISLQESAQRFRSAMAGSSEVLDMLGINIKEAALNQALLDLGFGKISDGATEQQKILARYMIILQAMRAQGSDMADVTMWTLPRAFEVFKGALNDFLISGGEPFLGVVTSMLQGLAAIVRGISQLAARFPGVIRYAAMMAFSIGAVGASLAVAGGLMLLIAKYASTSAMMMQVYAAATNSAAASNVRFAATGFRMVAMLSNVATLTTAIVAALGILAVATDESRDGISNLAAGWSEMVHQFSRGEWINGVDALMTTIQIAFIQMGNAFLRVIGWVIDHLRRGTLIIIRSLIDALASVEEVIPEAARRVIGLNPDVLREKSKEMSEQIDAIELGINGGSVMDPNTEDATNLAKEIQRGEERINELSEEYRRRAKQRREMELARQEEEMKNQEKRIQEMADKIRGTAGKAFGSNQTASAVTYRSAQGWETAYQNQQAALHVLERIVYVSEENRDANQETAEAVKKQPALAGVD